MHLQDAFVEISRYLLANGASLIYGGDLRPGGFTETLFGLAKLYKTPERSGVRVYNYEAWPIHLSLKKEYQTKFSEQVEFIQVDAPVELQGDPTVSLPPDTPQNRFIWARSLTKMRTLMNSVATARVFLGGQLDNYKGAYPGLLEEAIFALESKCPVYLVGAFGGVTERVIESILTQKTTPIEYWYEPNTDAERDFRSYYNKQLVNETIDFRAQAETLSKINLKRLAKFNKLSEEENRRLFITPHLFEIVHLIMTGLSRIAKIN